MRVEDPKPPQPPEPDPEPAPAPTPQPMRAGYVTGQVYRAGPRGVVITWRDGSTTTYPGRALVVLEHQPLKIQGRLFRSVGQTSVSYEAPSLVPQP